MSTRRYFKPTFYRNPLSWYNAMRASSARRSAAFSASRDRLTGGTKDVNPQWFKGQITQSAADTTTSSDFQLPITRIPSANKVTIIEVLKILATPETYPWVTAVELQEVEIAFCTRDFAANAAEWDEGTVFAHARVDHGVLGAAGGYQAKGDVEIDLSDGAGHGVLVATDKLYVQVRSAATTKTQKWNFALLYRFKTVGMREYVGIVQSQQ